MSEDTIPLIIAQHTLTGHPRRTEHWNLVAPINRNIAHVYELAGNIDTFHYNYKFVDDFAESNELCGGVEIGKIRSDVVGTWLKEKLREVKVVRLDPNFDCQTWIIDAILLLKECGGIVRDGVSERGIRKELEVEKERWELGEDTVFERLFSI